MIPTESNGTYTLTLPVKQVTKLNVTGYLTGLTIGDVTYTGTLTGEIEKGNGILTIKNLPASVLTGSDVNKSLTVTCNIQMDLSLLGEINTTALFAVQQSMCFSTKSVAILSSCITAFSAPFITLRTLRRIWRLLWVAIMAPAAPRAAPAAMPTTMPAAEFSRCFILNFSFQPVMTGLAVLLFP